MEEIDELMTAELIATDQRPELQQSKDFLAEYRKKPYDKAESLRLARILITYVKSL